MSAWVLGSTASAQACFEATRVVTVQAQPTAQALADFNSDGVVDLALLETQASVVAVHLGRGDSSFEPAVLYPVPGSSSQLAAADIDLDGAVDLVLIGSFLNACVVRNLGGATFAPPVQFGTGLTGFYTLTALAVVDFDSDGDPDLALARTFDLGSINVSSDVGIMFNQAGAFPLPPQWVSTGPQARGPKIVAFDVDGDGDRDLGVATTQQSGNASAGLFVNQGGVLLGSQALQVPLGSAASILSADYDVDGFADLAIATPTGVSILRNLGNSTFAPPVPTPPSTFLSAAASGDLDADGDADLVSIRVTSSPPAVLVYRNQGSLQFALEGPFPVASASDAVLAQDLDGDGDLDLCVMSTAGRVVTLLTNPGTGVFSPGLDPSLGGSFAQQMRALDTDLDGDLDLIAADSNANRWSVLPNDGSGAFGAVIPTPLGIGVERFTTLDYDSDGRVDLASTSITGMVALHRNTPAGIVSTGSYPVGFQPAGVTSADLDGDLDPDLVVANSGSTTISVLLNQGGTFGPQATYDAWFAPRAITAGDLDGDGDTDLVVANLGISVLLNNGAGSFGPPTNYTGFGSANSIVLGDLDSDGDLDVAASCGVGIVVFPNAGNSILSPFVTNAINGDASELNARDLDGDGDLDLVGLIASSRLMITLQNQGPGTFAPPEGYFLVGAPISVVCDDLDNDGDFDVAVARDFSPPLVKLVRNCSVSGTVVCAGDGLGTACPCANNSPVAARAGCQNSLGSGGSLRGSGSAVLAQDDFELRGAQMPNGAALYFQSVSLTGGGAVFGDGLFCAAGAIVRLGVQFNVGGQSAHPGSSGPKVSVTGAIATPGERYYQIWYRDSASFCTTSTFNLSNALRVSWRP